MSTNPKDLPNYEYVCDRGHSIGADTPVQACPLATCGSTELTRIGKGSRTKEDADV